ncbi:unnamed protein product, partial [Mesorhabditis spiculigera]
MRRILVYILYYFIFPIAQSCASYGSGGFGGLIPTQPPPTYSPIGDFTCCLVATPACPSGEYTSFVLIQFENGTTSSRGIGAIGPIQCTSAGKWEVHLSRRQPGNVRKVTCYQFSTDNQQSPIDILTNASTYDPNLTFFDLNYYPNDGYRLQWGHIAHGFYIYTTPPNDRSTFTSSSTDGIPYYLYQMHGHWGNPFMNGSEHLLDGQRLPAELHFVHYNRDEYGTFDNSVGKPNGIAVIAVFVEVGAANAEFDKILRPIQEVEELTKEHNATEQHEVIGVGFDYAKMIPDDHSYYTYTGSLTTGNYRTCVQWTVLRQSVTISHEQRELAEFAQFLTTEKPERQATNSKPMIPTKEEYFEWADENEDEGEEFYESNDGLVQSLQKLYDDGSKKMTFQQFLITLQKALKRQKKQKRSAPLLITARPEQIF